MLANKIRMTLKKLKRLIDRTTPTTVINQPYSTEGNGGRKLVRLDNGWLVAGVKDGAILRLYISKNNGSSFELLGSTGGVALGDWTITSNYNNIHIVLQANTTSIASYSFDVVTFIMGSGISSGTAKFAYIDQNQSTLGNCSLAINPQGTEIHACWSSKNTTYPNSFNIRYCKGVINGDGSVTWGSVEQVTSVNTSGLDLNNPTIVLNITNNPVIIYQRSQTSSMQILRAIKTTTWSSGLSSVYEVYNGGNYTQSSPSSCVDKDGVIHVAWNSQINTTPHYKVCYSKSTDTGITWITPVEMVVAAASPYFPSISINNNNILFIQDSTLNGTNISNYTSSDKGISWIYSPLQSVAKYPSLLDDNTLDFEEPLGIYMTTASHATYPNSVVFRGKWYE